MLTKRSGKFLSFEFKIQSTAFNISDDKCLSNILE